MKRIDYYLHYWFCFNTGLNIKFTEGDCFEQDTLNNQVTYSFTEKTPYDNVFRDLCIDIEPKAAEFDNFILNLFHEVGHIISDDDWSDKECERYLKFINKLSAKKTLTEQDYIKYYNHPVEYVATEEGLALISDNLIAVRELQDAIKTYQM